MEDKSRRPLLFLTNDDGIAAPGLAALAGSVMELGELVIIAPQHPRSGASHAVTLANPLRLVEQPFPPAMFAAATDGTRRGFSIAYKRDLFKKQNERL